MQVNTTTASRTLSPALQAKSLRRCITAITEAGISARPRAPKSAEAA